MPLNGPQLLLEGERNTTNQTPEKGENKTIPTSIGEQTSSGVLNAYAGDFELPKRYKLRHTGKVRDTYENPNNPEELIVIATDRISTHDVVHKSKIPEKGKTLTTMTKNWFNEMAKDPEMKDIKTQFIDNQTFPEDFPEALKERTIIVKKLKPLPIEAIIRGYIYGSALREYDATTGKLGTGEEVGKNLVKCSKFPSPLFTPSTKGKKDININEEGMGGHLITWIEDCTSLPQTRQEELEGLEGENRNRKCEEYATSLTQQVKALSLKVYDFIAKKTDEKGIILGDTKFEFGLDKKGEIYIIDEIGTPDSSRFWEKEGFEEGKEPKSYDKEPTREYVAAEWKKQGPVEGKENYPLELPKEVIEATSKRYQALCKLFTA